VKDSKPKAHRGKLDGARLCPLHWHHIHRERNQLKQVIFFYKNSSYFLLLLSCEKSNMIDLIEFHLFGIICRFKQCNYLLRESFLKPSVDIMNRTLGKDHPLTNSIKNARINNYTRYLTWHSG
jgi:hypothetical protein